MHKKSLILFLLLFSFSYGINGTESAATENFWIWTALFALGFVGVLILYISSLQTKKIEKIHKDMFERQKALEKNQTMLLIHQ